MAMHHGWFNEPLKFEPMTNEGSMNWNTIGGQTASIVSVQLAEAALPPWQDVPLEKLKFDYIHVWEL